MRYPFEHILLHPVVFLLAFYCSIFEKKIIILVHILNLHPEQTRMHTTANAPLSARKYIAGTCEVAMLGGGRSHSADKTALMKSGRV